MEVIVWIAEDGSGDLFFDDSEWGQKLAHGWNTRPEARAVTVPFSRSLVEDSIWEPFEKGWEERQRPFAEREGREYEKPWFYPRCFVKTVIPVEVQTTDFPMYTGLDPEDELPRLARWKALCALSLDRILTCQQCHEGRLAPDGERLRCLRCEHGPSDWQRRPMA